jgi:hypothetical protein
MLTSPSLSSLTAQPSSPVHGEETRTVESRETPKVHSVPALENLTMPSGQSAAALDGMTMPTVQSAPALEGMTTPSAQSVPALEALTMPSVEEQAAPVVKALTMPSVEQQDHPWPGTERRKSTLAATQSTPVLEPFVVMTVTSLQPSDSQEKACAETGELDGKL